MNILTSTLLNQIETNLASTEIQDLFVVTINSFDETTNTIICNASYNDIIAAIQANKFIILTSSIIDNIVYFLHSYSIDNLAYTVEWYFPSDEILSLVTSSPTSTSWEVFHGNEM